MHAVKESCASARLSLDLHYEKMKMEVISALEERYYSLVDVIDKAKKADLDSLSSFQNQLQHDLSKVKELIAEGVQICLSLQSEIQVCVLRYMLLSS